jgi:hypothetical protein
VQRIEAGAAREARQVVVAPAAHSPAGRWMQAHDLDAPAAFERRAQAERRAGDPGRAVAGDGG